MSLTTDFNAKSKKKMHMKDNIKQNRRVVQVKLRILEIKLIPKTLRVNNHEEFPNKCREKLFRLCGFDPRFPPPLSQALQLPNILLFRKHLPSGVNFFTYSNTQGLAAFAASSRNEITVQPSAGRKLRHDGFVPFQMQLTDSAQEVHLRSRNTASLQPMLIPINQRKQITQQE